MIDPVLAEEALDGPARTPAPVTLMNMHKSKGKEFGGVIIVEGLYQGRLLTPGADAVSTRDERRLLRVALTGALHHVVLVRPRHAMDLTRPVLTTPLRPPADRSLQ